VTTALIGLLVVLLTAMLAVAGLLVVHRLVPLSIRESHTAAIGIIYAALYVMFGMMVGFSVSAYIVLNKYKTRPRAR
jgi:predicted histidine transporter YuiF (NhaC family)